MNYTKALENKLIQLFINNNMRVHEDELLKLMPLNVKSERKKELDKHLNKLCENINKSIKAKIVRDYRFYVIKF